MEILFAAPEEAWDGFLGRLRDQLPGYRLTATGRFGFNDLTGYDVLIPALSAVSAESLATADRLKLIQQCGTGLDKIDLAAAARRNIPVANVPSGVSGNADAVAELGIYLLIGLARNAGAMAHSLAGRMIGEPAGKSLYGKTVGIVGLGDIGRALVRRLRPFAVRMIGVKRTDPERARRELRLDWVGSPVDLPYLLAQSDFVILCAPLTSATRGLMNRETFGCMKRGAYLINLARGGLVDASALREALASGRIGGAGLDVFWEEPPDPHDPIFTYNVIATPHVGGSTDVSLEGIGEIMAENIHRLASGQELLYVRNAVGPVRPLTGTE